MDIPKPDSFPPTEELRRYRHLIEILKPYHNPKKIYLLLLLIL